MGPVDIAGAGAVVTAGTGFGAWMLRRLAIDGGGAVAGGGDGAWALRRPAMAGSGSVVAVGSGEWATRAVLFDGSGKVINRGSGSWPLGRIGADGAGAVVTAGTGYGAWKLRRATLAGSGSVAGSGDGVWTTRRLAMTGLGSVMAAGTGEWTTRAALVAGAGGVVNRGSGAWGMGPLDADGAGAVANVARVSLGWKLKRLGLGGSGSVRTTGDGAWALEPVVIAGMFAEPVTADFRTALRARLKGAPELAGLTEVYWRRSPPSAILPFLIVDDLSSTPRHLTGDYYTATDLQFTIFSPDDREAETLGAEAWSALAPGEGDSPLLFVEGRELRQRVPWMMRGPTADEKGVINGKTVWRTHFDCRFFIARAYRGGVLQ